MNSLQIILLRKIRLFAKLLYNDANVSAKATDTKTRKSPDLCRVQSQEQYLFCILYFLKLFIDWKSLKQLKCAYTKSIPHTKKKLTSLIAL